MLSCAEVARLVSLSQQRKLSLGEQMKLWAHFALCGVCRQYQQGMSKIDQYLKACSSCEDREQATLTEAFPETRMSEECRQKMQAKMLEELKSSSSH